MDHVSTDIELSDADAASSAAVSAPLPFDPASGQHTWPAGVSPAPRERKVLLSLRIDDDVLKWFRACGAGYQTRMNAVLRAYKEHARDDG